MGMYELTTKAVSSLIAVVAPRRAIQYSLARRIHREIGRRGYDAAYAGGPNRRWLPVNRTADAEIHRSAERIRARARDLVRNNPFVAGAVNTICSNVVGTGIIPQAKVRKANGELDEKFNAKIEEYWARWAPYADIAERLHFYEIQRLVLRHLIVDGEVLIHKVRREYAAVEGIPLRLEILECDFLDSSIDQAQNGNIVRQGVEVNQFGRPVAYWIHDSHPGDTLKSSSSSRRIPAADIIHLFVQERASQTRGVSWLAPIIMRMYDLDEYQDYEMIGAKLAAAFGVFIKTAYPEMFNPAQIPEDKAGDEATPLQYIEPGRIERLAPGEEIQVASHDRPGGNYSSFIQSVLRAGAAGLGIAYEPFSRDYTSATFSSARAAALEERRFYRWIQQILLYKLNMPIWREFILSCFASGTINMPAYKNNPQRYEAVRWIAPGWEWVDPLKEAKAAETELELGITTRSKLAASRGEDIEDVFQELAREQARIKELDIADILGKKEKGNALSQ